MTNLIEQIIIIMTNYNFREIDNKYLLSLDFVLFAVITSVGRVGTIESLDFTLDHNLRQIFWSAYGVAMSFAMRYLVTELYKKYKAWKFVKTTKK